MNTDRKKIIIIGLALLFVAVVILAVAISLSEPGVEEKIEEIKEKIISEALVKTSTGVSILLVDKDYSIFYAEKEDEFRLIIEGENFALKQEVAEKRFLSLVEENTEVACALNVIVIPKSNFTADESESPLPLSFCGDFQ